MTLSDRAERQKLVNELHKQVIEDVPLIFMFNGVDAIAHSKRVKGFQPWQSKLRMWEVTAN